MVTIGACSGRWSMRLVVAAVAAAVLTVHVPAGLTAAPARAAEGQTAAALGVTVEFGYGRGLARDSWTLVEVTASPPVPLRGRLRAQVGGALGTTAAERSIEVAAGATQVFHLLLPPTDQVEVTYLDDGGDRVALAGGWREADRSVRVGGLSAAPDLPEPLNTLGTDRAVRPVVVDPAALALGPRALDALDAILVSAGDLAALTELERQTIAVAVSNGLDLIVPVVAGDGPLPLPWNPVEAVVGLSGEVELDPAAGAWAATRADLGLRGDEPIAASMRAGRGRVVAIAAVPGDGGLGSDRDLWSSLLQVRTDVGGPLAALDQGNELTGMLFGGEFPLPGVMVFAIFVLVYIVLVGPVNGLVLRRLGRRELAWVTVPLLTLAFTVVAVTTAAGRAPVQTPVVRAAWWLDGVGQELTVAAIQAPSRGVVDVRLPGNRDGLGGQLWGSTTSTVERTDDTTAVRVQLETLAQASVLAWGDPDGPPPLEVAAGLEGGRATLEVTNTTSSALDDVEVMLATSVTKVGRLDPGEHTTLVIDDLEPTLKRANNAGRLNVMGARVPRAGSGPRAVQSLMAWNVLDGSPGIAWVTATSTSDLGLAVPEAPGTIDDRGTFVAVGTTLQATGDDLLPHAVTRDVLRTEPEGGWRPAPLEIEGVGELVLRFRLPGPAIQGTLLSTLDAGGPVGMNGGGDIWSGGCFEVVEIAPDGTESDPEERCGGDEVPCPPAANGCGGDDRAVEACFDDGRCQVATFLGIDEFGPDAPGGGDGFEVFDHHSGAWLPSGEAFPDGTADDGNGFVSPLGEVLVRVRDAGLVDIAQRGIGMDVLATRGSS